MKLFSDRQITSSAYQNFSFGIFSDDITTNFDLNITSIFICCLVCVISGKYTCVATRESVGHNVQQLTGNNFRCHGRHNNFFEKRLSTKQTGCSRKTAQSFTHDKFGSVRRRLNIFLPKCSSEITVYQSMQNLCKWVKYSLLNSRKWLHVSRTVRRRTDRYTLTILQTDIHI